MTSMTSLSVPVRRAGDQSVDATGERAVARSITPAQRMDALRELNRGAVQARLPLGVDQDLLGLRPAVRA